MGFYLKNIIFDKLNQLIMRSGSLGEGGRCISCIFTYSIVSKIVVINNNEVMIILYAYIVQVRL